MEHIEISDSQLVWLVTIIYAMIPVFIFVMPLFAKLLDLAFSSRERLCFMCDMHEYEEMLYHGRPLPGYLRDRDFRILVWCYHKCYGQYRYPKPTTEGKKKDNQHQ